MSESVLPMFSSKSFIVSGLTFRSLIHFWVYFCVWCQKVFQFHTFACRCPVFPASLVEMAVFSPLYILASFVKDKLSIGVLIYLWAFYVVPLIYISVFVPVPYCLDDCSFVVQFEVSQVDSCSSILLSQDCFFLNNLDCFYISIQIVKLFVLLL